MREIKLRAWNKKYSFMFDNHIVFPSDNCNFYYDVDLHPERPEHRSLTPGKTGITDILIMQYSGLKDENDRELYEGDILTDNLGQILQVKFEDCAFRLVFKNSFGAWTNIRDHRDAYKMQLIGNIYENPELLK